MKSNDTFCIQYESAWYSWFVGIQNNVIQNNVISKASLCLWLRQNDWYIDNWIVILQNKYNKQIIIEFVLPFIDDNEANQFMIEW